MLLLAIAIMVLVGTLMNLMLSFTTLTVKQTGDIYLKEQTELMARSATEYAILKISGNNWADKECINKIDELSGYKNFNINITMHYFGKDLPSNCNMLDNNLYTKESNATVLIDVIVHKTDPITFETIRFHKRIIQKP